MKNQRHKSQRQSRCHKNLHRSHPDIVPIAITGFGTIEAAVKAIRSGAIDYLTKPLDVEQLTARLRVAERVLSLQREVRQLKEFLSVCSYCRKIRLDDDSWTSLERYLSLHTNLSHGMCPECYAIEAKPQLDRLVACRKERLRGE